jgi:hypothetical protein
VLRKAINQPCQEIIDATVANTEAVTRLEGQFGHLVVEFNRIKEEEFQSQEMARGQYMIDEDCPSDPVHATTTLVSEEKAVSNVEEKEEHLEQIEPPPIPIFSNDNEVSTKAHSLNHNPSQDISFTTSFILSMSRRTILCSNL